MATVGPTGELKGLTVIGVSMLVHFAGFGLDVAAGFGLDVAADGGRECDGGRDGGDCGGSAGDEELGEGGELGLTVIGVSMLVCFAGVGLDVAADGGGESDGEKDGGDCGGSAGDEELGGGGEFGGDTLDGSGVSGKSGGKSCW